MSKSDEIRKIRERIIGNLYNRKKGTRHEVSYEKLQKELNKRFDIADKKREENKN